MPKPQSRVVDWNNYDHRFAGPTEALTDVVTLSSGQVLPEGSVLGKVTATGEYVLSCKTLQNGDPVTDGSEKPSMVLVEDCDASDGDKTPLVYKTGHFLSTWLKLGHGHTFLTVKDELRHNGIHYSHPAT